MIPNNLYTKLTHVSSSSTEDNFLVSPAERLMPYNTTSPMGPLAGDDSLSTNTLTGPFTAYNPTRVDFPVTNSTPAEPLTYKNDHYGAMVFIVATVCVYGLSIVFFIAGHTQKRELSKEEERQISHYLKRLYLEEPSLDNRKFHVIRLKSQLLAGSALGQRHNRRISLLPRPPEHLLRLGGGGNTEDETERRGMEDHDSKASRNPLLNFLDGECSVENVNEEAVSFNTAAAPSVPYRGRRFGCVGLSPSVRLGYYGSGGGGGERQPRPYMLTRPLPGIAEDALSSRSLDDLLTSQEPHEEDALSSRSVDDLLTTKEPEEEEELSNHSFNDSLSTQEPDSSKIPPPSVYPFPNLSSETLSSDGSSESQRITDPGRDFLTNSEGTIESQRTTDPGRDFLTNSKGTIESQRTTDPGRDFLTNSEGTIESQRTTDPGRDFLTNSEGTIESQRITDPGRDFLTNPEGTIESQRITDPGRDFLTNPEGTIESQRTTDPGRDFLTNPEGTIESQRTTDPGRDFLTNPEGTIESQRTTDPGRDFLTNPEGTIESQRTTDPGRDFLTNPEGTIESQRITDPGRDFLTNPEGSSESPAQCLLLSELAQGQKSHETLLDYSGPLYPVREEHDDDSSEPEMVTRL
ncbi:hypothetical protein ACOMHN_025984 [Nucella lapillus]